MAVLKDLIVHGSSRFLNKIYANLILAESGIFNKLIAKDATMENATVVGLLDVQGLLHTNAWTNSNIATIDGSFYITPTISSAEGTASNISATTIQFVPRNNTFAVVSSLYYYDTSAHEGTWLKYSKVLVTGLVLLNGEWIPLGTILGYLNTDGTANSLVIAGAEDNKHRASPVLALLVANGVTTSTSLNYRNLKVSLYQRSSSSSNNADAYKYPLGIFMTAMGTNGKTFLDIYGGGNVLTTTYGGYADPNVRIGNLSGLPAVGNQTPVGWGIYTTNGYFKGTVAAQLGVIGGWTIASDGLYYGGSSTAPGANNVLLSPGKSSSTAIGGSSGTLTWVITAGTTFGVTTGGDIYATSGKIGGFTIGINEIKNTKTSYSETSNNGVWLGTTGIGLGKGTFYVTDAGAMTAKSGTIAGWSFNTTSLYKTNATPGYNASTMVLSTGTASTNNIGGGGTSSKTWMISAGIGFGVTTAGTLYCNDAHISGEITATSGTIGGASITNGTLTVPAAQVSGELTAATINGSKITANTITASQIATNAITADELAANAVTSVKIKAGEVKATNIASNAVTADKLDATTINASNKLTIGAMTTTTQNNILNSNIQIGGINLLKNTDATTIAKTITIASTSSSNYSEGWTATVTRIEGENTYTVSFDAKADTDGIVAICHWYSPNTTTSSISSTGQTSSSSDGNCGVTLTTEWKRYWVTWTQSDTASTNKSLIVCRLHKPSSGTKTVEVRAIKMEVGNKATAWSPAPEDIDVHKYVTDIDSNKGITIKPADTSGKDYLQINSSAINFYRNDVETLEIADSTIRVGKLGNNLRNIYITDSAVQIRNNETVLAEYGSSIKLYKPGTTTSPAVEISSTGATFTGGIVATSLTINSGATVSGSIPQSNITNLTTDLGNKASTTALNTEINQRKATYGTQTATSSDAATQAKAITCSNFELVAGNEITIYFKYANTYATNAVQLNVNSKGAKNIWVANAVTSSTNKLLWGAGAYITFKYDGTQFIVVGEPRTWYGACSTAASTAAKTDTTGVKGCVICKGTKVNLAMTNENTASAPTLNIQSTGALAIYAGTGTTRPLASNGLSWSSATSQEFVFDGVQWRTGDSGTMVRSKALSDAAAKTASNYIVADSTGLMVADMSGGAATSSNVSSQNVFIDSNSINIRNGQDVLAKFGATGARVGLENASHIDINNNSISLVNEDKVEWFDVNLEAGTITSLATLPHSEVHVTSHTITGNTTETGSTVINVTEVPTGEEIQADFMRFNFGSYYYFDGHAASPKSLGNRIEKTISVYSREFKKYIKGTAGSSYTYEWSNIKIYSTSSGTGTPAANLGLTLTMQYSGGNFINMSYTVSITNFKDDFTLYYFGNPYGIYEKTSLGAALSFGERTGDIGIISTILGTGLEAGYSNQLVIGKYNINNENNIFEIGDGEKYTVGNEVVINPKNAFAFTKNGDIEMFINTSTTDGVPDDDLYALIVALGWENEVMI